MTTADRTAAAADGERTRVIAEDMKDMHVTVTVSGDTVSGELICIASLPTGSPLLILLTADGSYVARVLADVDSIVRAR